MFQLMPVFYFIRRKCYPGGYTPEAYDDELMRIFAEKLWTVSKQDTLRVSYELYDVLRSVSDAEVEYLAKHSIHYLVKTLEFVLRVS